MATELEKAYLAGLVDGEGTIHIVRQSNKSRSRPVYFFSEMYVVNTDLEMLLWVKQRFGGGIRLDRKTRPRNNKPLYRVHWHRSCAEVVTRMIYPYLVTKKRQASLLLEFGVRMSQYQHPLSEAERKMREEIYWACRFLNVRGIDGVERLSERASELGFDMAQLMRQSEPTENEPLEGAPKSLPSSREAGQ